jgi:crotonobetainyl-CoA:carnitine CoA-transferase CaiB-like acyl-CoA transferase
LSTHTHVDKARDDKLLTGAKVLELSSTVAGAYCGHLVALMGAEVSRLSQPLSADCPPPVLASLEDSLHAGKGQVAADDDDALAAALADADLVFTDSRVDDACDGAFTSTTARTLARIRPGCAVVDITRPAGAGPALDGSPIPCVATPMTVSAAAAMSWGIGRPGEAPLALPYDLSDYLVGTESAGAVALALLLRRVDPTESQRWSVSSTEVVASYVGQISSNFLPYERPWTRDGARATLSGGSYPGAMFPCRDGNVSIMCRTNREWTALIAAMGDPPWSRRQGYDDARIVAAHHADEVDVYVKSWTSAMTVAEITRIGGDFNFPVASILTVAEAVSLNDRAGSKLFKTAATVARAPWVVREVANEDSDSSPPGRRLGLAPQADKPLNGLRVLDLSWVWSGPMVTAALADLGAEIIKIEHRKRPDPARLRGRAIRDGVPVSGPELELSPYFNQMNRGKKSVSVDISTEAGRDVILRLAGVCDVAVENMRPGALERRGLDYAALSRQHPGLVMLSMSMMGQVGPMRGVSGYAPVMSGLSGVDSLVGYDEDNLIGLYNPALGDPNGAAHALALLMGALYRRAQTGRGSWLDVAQVECFLSTLRVPVAIAASGRPPRVPANGHATYFPHGTYAAAGPDEWVSVAARTDAERIRLGSLVADAGPSTPGGPTAPGDLERALTQWLSRRRADEAAGQLRAAGVPASRVEHVEDVLTSDWAARTGLFRMLTHPHLGPRPAFTIPWRRGGRPFGADAAAPLLAAQTAEVLRDILGVSEEELRDLHDAGAIEARELTA